MKTRYLYDHALHAWETGDWSGLANLAEQPIEQEEKRDRLALLVAAGLAQQGSLDGTQRHIDLARAWGCPEDAVAQILLSSAYNSLGRAALHLDGSDEADRYFREALSASGASGNLQELTKRRKASESQSLRGESSSPSGLRIAREEILTAFRKTLPDWHCESDLPYVLETKSLPRSGLHFFKSCFETALQKRFSFCEWYQEPGCCRSFPCKVGKFSLKHEASEQYTLRMIKSHDFELSDPDYPPPPGVLRVIMIRDPLMVLTSWWTLSELVRHTKVLSSHGIDMRKIYFQHEKAVLAEAYRIVQDNFLPLPQGHLENWLHKQEHYIIGFLQKWCIIPAPQVHIVRYEELPGFVDGYFEDRKARLSEEEYRALEVLRSSKLAEFRPRSEAQASKIMQVSVTLKQNMSAFQHASNRIRQETSALWPSP